MPTWSAPSPPVARSVSGYSKEQRTQTFVTLYYDDGYSISSAANMNVKQITASFTQIFTYLMRTARKLDDHGMTTSLFNPGKLHLITAGVEIGMPSVTALKTRIHRAPIPLFGLCSFGTSEP